MSDGLNDLMESVRQEAEARSHALQRLLSGADASRVFGPPVTNGAYTVITAAEIASGGGLGSGMGFGGPGGRKRHAAAEEPEGTVPAGAGAGETGSTQATEASGAGGGGGGGGGSMGRPVAAIVIGPDGVAVRPVVDITKLALTGLGAFTAVTVLVARMMRKKTR